MSEPNKELERAQKEYEIAASQFFAFITQIIHASLTEIETHIISLDLRLKNIETKLDDFSKKMR